MCLGVQLFRVQVFWCLGVLVFRFCGLGLHDLGLRLQGLVVKVTGFGV